MLGSCRVACVRRVNARSAYATASPPEEVAFPGVSAVASAAALCSQTRPREPKERPSLVAPIPVSTETLTGLANRLACTGPLAQVGDLLEAL